MALLACLGVAAGRGPINMLSKLLVEPCEVASTRDRVRKQDESELVGDVVGLAAVDEGMK
jgi:hypothetical protein